MDDRARRRSKSRATDPWNSYYAARFAWPDETADLWRGVGLARQKTDAARLEAPEYLEIDNGSGRLTIFTGGLPYHRRSDPRMLDTLLVVRGETCPPISAGDRRRRCRSRPPRHSTS